MRTSFMVFSEFVVTLQSETGKIAIPDGVMTVEVEISALEMRL